MQSTSAPLRVDSLRLEPGSHASPDQGVCIVELASILAKEKFSDEPDCVCEVIGAFLRSWNDRASHVDRQRLRPYAARIVGTRSGRAITHSRRDFCLAWSELAGLDGGPLSRSLARLRARIRLGWVLGFRSALRLNRGAGEYAALVCFSRHDSEASFRLLDRLLRLGEEEQGPPSRLVAPQAEPSAPAALNGGANGNGRTNGNGEAEGFVHAVLRARALAEDEDEDEGEGEGDDSGDRAMARSNGNGNAAAPRRRRRSPRP
jgi:hypothetical protein